jgi:arylsulfatase
MSSKNDREIGAANKREGMRRRTLLLGTTSLVAASGITATAPSVRAQQPQEILPKLEPPFQGKIGRTLKDSTPDFPRSVEAPAGAPNVLLILTDDVGFGATSTFGGPIQTPNFQRLADSGLRYNMYHTTALCSPTRAALITGRNHHSVASGVITEFATGYPGDNSLVPKSAGSVGSVLKDSGYNTSWFGKMHNVPDWMSSQAGPFDLWPTGLGFEHFYGFLGGDSDQWHPALYDGTKTFDVGEDTGTPVLETYEDKMPFRFTGTLKRFVAVLEPSKLSSEEQQGCASNWPTLWRRFTDR